MSKIYSYQLMKKGGKWLGALREALYQYEHRFKKLEWGNKEHAGQFSVYEIENLASYAAAGAVNEHCEELELRLERYRKVVVKLLEKSNVRDSFLSELESSSDKDFFTLIVLNSLLEDKNVKFE